MDTIIWKNLTRIQKNALIAEKVDGWVWVPYDYYDCTSVKNQVWLMPDPSATKSLSPGEWTFINEGPDGRALDNKMVVPNWLGDYIDDIDYAIDLVERKDLELHIGRYVRPDHKSYYGVTLGDYTIAGTYDSIRKGTGSGRDENLALAISFALLEYSGIIVDRWKSDI